MTGCAKTARRRARIQAAYSDEWRSRSAFLRGTMSRCRALPLRAEKFLQQSHGLLGLRVKRTLRLAQQLRQAGFFGSDIHALTAALMLACYRAEFASLVRWPTSWRGRNNTN